MGERDFRAGDAGARRHRNRRSAVYGVGSDARRARRRGGQRASVFQRRPRSGSGEDGPDHCAGAARRRARPHRGAGAQPRPSARNRAADQGCRAALSRDRDRGTRSSAGRAGSARADARAATPGGSACVARGAARAVVRTDARRLARACRHLRPLSQPFPHAGGRGTISSPFPWREGGRGRGGNRVGTDERQRARRSAVRRRPRTAETRACRIESMPRSSLPRLAA